MIAAEALAVGLVVLLTVREPKPEGRAAGPAGAPSILATFRDNGSLRVLLAVLFLTVFSTWTVDPIMPLHVGTFAVAAVWVPVVAGAVLSAAGIANVLAAPWLGRLGDRRGHRPVLLACLTGGVLSGALGTRAVFPATAALLVATVGWFWFAANPAGETPAPARGDERLTWTVAALSRAFELPGPEGGRPHWRVV